MDASRHNITDYTRPTARTEAASGYVREMKPMAEQEAAGSRQDCSRMGFPELLAFNALVCAKRLLALRDLRGPSALPCLCRRSKGPPKRQPQRQPPPGRSLRSCCRPRGCGSAQAAEAPRSAAVPQSQMLRLLQPPMLAAAKSPPV